MRKSMLLTGVLALALALSGCVPLPNLIPRGPAPTSTAAADAPGCEDSKWGCDEKKPVTTPPKPKPAAPIVPAKPKVPKGYRDAGNGLAYRWAKKPLSCDYYTSCVTLVLYAMEPCNDIYVEANLLNRNDAVIGYTNALVQRLERGQIAKVKLSSYLDGVETFSLTEIKCY